MNAPHNVVAASEAASRKQLGKPSGRRESVANPLISVESLTPYGLLFLLVSTLLVIWSTAMLLLGSFHHPNGVSLHLT